MQCFIHEGAVGLFVVPRTHTGPFPFEQTLVHKDKFYECLKMQNEIIDSIAVQVAQTLFIAFHKSLKVAMKDQLPGGLYYVPNLDVVDDTVSYTAQ